MGIFSFKKERTAYFPGCKTSNENIKKYEEILKKLNVDFTTIDEICCGLPAKNLGYEFDFRKQARKNLELLKEKKIDKIITSCPVCFATFRQYKDILPDWAMEIDFITKAIVQRITKLESREKTRASLHYCCYLGDKQKQELKQILENLGFELAVLENYCCCQLENAEISEKIIEKIINDAKQKGTDKIITNCPHCFLKLKKQNKIKITEFSEAIMEVFGLIK